MQFYWFWYKIYWIEFSKSCYWIKIFFEYLNVSKIFFTGLDPAGPLFYFLNSHLISSDAKFVDIIHADIGGYGLALKTGDVDFFPNYGHRPQPNCPLFGLLLSQMGSHKISESWFF